MLRPLHYVPSVSSGMKQLQQHVLLKNRSLVIPRHRKTSSIISSLQKPSVPSSFHIFGSLCSYRITSSSDPVTMFKNTDYFEQDSLSPGLQSQENVPQVAETVTMSNELELLYSLMFSELINGTSHVMSKSSAVHVADNPNKHQQHNTTHTSTTTDVIDPPPLNIQSTHQTPTQVPTVTAPKNIIQAETNTENAQFDKDEFINIFSTLVQE
ncbi:hypothetical protein Tco_0210113 [Tanacetum coccineum]